MSKFEEEKKIEENLAKYFASSSLLEANAKTILAHCSGPIIIDQIMLILV